MLFFHAGSYIRITPRSIRATLLASGDCLLRAAICSGPYIRLQANCTLPPASRVSRSDRACHAVSDPAFNCTSIAHCFASHFDRLSVVFRLPCLPISHSDRLSVVLRLACLPISHFVRPAFLTSLILSVRSFVPWLSTVVFDSSVLGLLRSIIAWCGVAACDPCCSMIYANRGGCSVYNVWLHL